MEFKRRVMNYGATTTISIPQNVVKILGIIRGDIITVNITNVHKAPQETEDPQNDDAQTPIEN